MTPGKLYLKIFLSFVMILIVTELLIFEPFYRTKETPETGFGLGLAIARKIIELHGGTILSPWYRWTSFSL